MRTGHIMKTSAFLGVAGVMIHATAIAAPDIQLENVVVTASRFVESVTSQGIGLEIISTENIAASTAQTLPQLLNQYAGIYSRDNSGTADRQIDLRGFGMSGDQNTAVVLDGQRLNENELVTVKWSSIPLSAIDRIEILRGSGAVLYGGGTTGGVIHIITKKPAATHNDDYVEARFGSFADRQFHAGLMAAGDILGLSIHASHQNTDGYRDNSGRRQSNMEGSLNLVSFPVGVELKFGAEDQFQEFPGARTAAQLRSDRRGTATPQDKGTRNGWHANLLTRGNLGEAEWNVDVGYSHTNRTAFMKDYFFGIFNTYLDTESDVASFSPRLKLPHHLFGGADSLVVGFDYEDWQYDSFRGAGSTAPAAALISASQQNRSLYALERIAVTSATQASFGARWQQVSYQASDSINPAIYAHGTNDETEHAYELGLRQALQPEVSIYGKIGHSFRLPTLDEIYSQYGGPHFDSIVTFLKPQTSREAEIGIETSSGNQHFRASLYNIRLDNEIHCMTTVAPGFCSNINLPPSERRGVELAGDTSIGANIDLRANYTYADSRFIGGSFLGSSIKDNEVPLVPRHRANLGLNWKLDAATSLSVTTQIVGSQRFDNDQSNSFFKKMPGYSTTDLFLQHQAGAWRFTGAINNLFDREYFTYGVRGGGIAYNAYPETERTFSISGEYRWR
jgi:iron complex outermembrane receptor protein